MPPSNKDAPYNKLRFDWKKAVRKDTVLSRGAKLLATVLCDDYVNKRTGCCWPKNKTLALATDTTVRTVQRHLKELLEQSYLEKTKREGIRRTFRIHFPDLCKNDGEHDTLSPVRMTVPSLESDTGDVPYKNQGYNQEKGPPTCGALHHLSINKNEVASMNEWRGWAQTHIDYDQEALFNFLRRDSVFRLPSRFPHEDKAKQYLEFFDRVITSRGKCLGG